MATASLAPPVEPTAICTKCLQRKPLSEFHARKNRRKGHKSRCIRCSQDDQRAHRRANPEKSRMQVRDWKAKNPESVKAMQRRTDLKRNFDMTPEDYDAKFEEQGGLCASCEDPPKVRRLAVGHDHETNEKRDLLCPRCNVALGMVLDDPDRLVKLLMYLRKHGKEATLPWP